MTSRVLTSVTRSAHRGAKALLGLAVGTALLAVPQSAAGAAVTPAPTGSAAATATPAAPPAPATSAGAAPATSAPTPATSAAPASRKPAGGKAPRAKAGAEGCGGALVLGTVVSCPEINVGARHVFTITTTLAGEELRLRLAARSSTRGDGDVSASVQAPDGNDICWLGSSEECVAPTVGTYTVTVRRDATSSPASDPVSYRLGAQSFSNPQGCAALPDDAFAFPMKALEGTLPEGSAGLCYSFDEPAGSLLRLSVTTSSSLRGHVVDAAGEVVCGLDYDIECRVKGSGPHRIVFASQWSEEGPYRFWGVRVSGPAGCAAMSPAGFGGPGDAAGSVTVDGSSLGCLAFTASAGPHLLNFGVRHSLEFQLVDRTGKQVCAGSDRATADCDLPEAGTYALITKNNYSEPRAVQAAIYPLASTAGCGAELATSWNSPPTRVMMASDLQVDCHLIDAAPGDRVKVDAPKGWITDASGERICDPLVDEDNEGCPLPGAGPYRVISAGYWNEDSAAHPYDITVVKLNGREGCETVTVGRYGAAPAGPLTTNRCRVLVVPAAGVYQVALVGEDNDEGYGDVYDSAGLRKCFIVCTFAAAGSYPVVTSDAAAYATVFLPLSAGNGCAAVSDAPLKAPHAGEFKVAGQYDCLLLPTAKGAGLALVRPQDSTGPGYPEMAVYDATGARACDVSDLRDYSCVLEGTAPFRAILHLDSDTDQVAGPYHLGFVRTGGTPACPALPRSAFGSATSTPVTLGGTAFVGCFSIPAGQHSAAEAITFRRTAGAGLARVSVFGIDGRRECLRSRAEAGVLICRLGAGAATVIVEGTAASGTYALHRRDLTGAAAGCRTITDTKVGGPALPGTLTSAGDLHCYRVTAAATDRLAIDSRDPDKQTRALVLDSAGADLGCSGLVSGCSVTGKSTYQVMVFGFGTASTAYELDTWKVWAGGKPAAECTTVPSIAYGFGPYTGTLSTAKPGACFVATRTRFDDLTLDVTNPTDPEDGFNWDAGMYAVTSEGMESCAIGQGGFSCWYRGSERSQTTMYLLTNGHRLEPHAYRVVATCERPLCGGSTFTVTAVAPAAVAHGGLRTITVRGTSLHLEDTVRITQEGQAARTATVKTVTPDRRTMTAQVDLTSAPPGPATVTVQPYAASLEPVTLTDALTVTRPLLQATKAPSISGTTAVGATVKAVVGGWTPAATSYAYRWAANGVTIKGATGASLPISAALLGKRLTVTVTASRTGHPSGSATSAASKPVVRGKAPAATRKPSITGTAKVGKKVKAAAGTWSPKADSYRYEWRVNGVLVRAATGASLKLTSSMRNKKLTVTVIARRAGHADGKAASTAVTVRR